MKKLLVILSILSIAFLCSYKAIDGLLYAHFVQQETSGGPTDYVLHYPFDGDYLDYSGNGHHATNYGTIFGTDRFQQENKSIYFDGNNDYLTTYEFDTLYYDSTMSLSVWVKTLGNGAQFIPIITSNTSITTNGRYGFYTELNNYPIIWQSGNNFKYFQNGSYQNDNVWHHWVFIFDGLNQTDIQNAKCYVDGSELSQQSVTNSLSLESLLYYFQVGRSGSFNDYFKGYMDDIKIYDRALTEPEIDSLYQENNYLEQLKYIFTASVTSGDSLWLGTVTGFNYDFTVDWGDGSQIDTVTAFDDVDRAHKYTSTDTVTVKLTGTATRLGFSSSLSNFNSKILTLEQFGDMGMITGQRMFEICPNITEIHANGGNASLIVGSNQYFRFIYLCNSLMVVDLNSLIVTSTTSLSSFSRSINNVDSVNINSWGVQDCDDFNGMFQDWAGLTYLGIQDLDISSMTSATAFCNASTLRTSNYDEILINWAAQAPNIQTGVTIDFGSSKYSSAASAARAVLTGTYSWVITDGGLE